MMIVDEVILSNQEYQSMHKKVQENIFKLAYIASSSHEYPKGKAFNEDLLNRYQFSKYLIDPNHRRFTVVMRIQSHVFRFINILKQRVQNKRNGNTTLLGNGELISGRDKNVKGILILFDFRAD